MRKPVSLSRYLVGNFALLLVPLLMASALSLWTIALQARRSFVDLASLSSSLVSSRFEEFFARPEEAATQIVAILEHRDLYPRSRLSEYLAGALAGFPYIDRLQVVGADNRVLAVVPADPSLLGMSRAGELVYEAVRRSQGLAWSESYISTSANRPALTFGRRAGDETLLCDLNLEWVADYARSLAVYAAPGVEVRVTDGNGVYLSNVDRDAVSRRERMPDFMRLRLRAGQHDLGTVREGNKNWLVSSARIGLPNWYVFVLYPESAFAGSLRTGYLELLLLFAIVALFGLLFWRRRFARVSVALAAISAETEKVSAGDYGEIGKLGSGFVEFLRIGESLSAMVSAIGGRERILLDRERGFRETLERIDLAAVGVDGEGRIRFANQFLLSATGYTREELEGRAIGTILASGPNGCPFDRLLSGREALSLERCALRTRGGGQRLVDWSIVRNLDADGSESGATGIGHDVTDVVRQQELVATSLREKEALLREVHHRVKNNLQVILSLLHLQETDSADPETARALGLSADRILSIALVHETIYGSEDFADLDFGDYASTLASQILSRPETRHIRLDLDLDTLRLDLIDAVPSGLFVNEAMRFILERIEKPEAGRREVIRLSIRKDEGRAFLSLSCPCHRSSAAAFIKAREADELLLRALAEQLHGKFSLNFGEGIAIDLVFRPRFAALHSR
ncbi:MAG TPA: histidine kinase dimerization/phosphoacceptor domain -containing protein [Rectinemataceae bacterium]|nr:histidine kinase dimerization/phosphoacceptor domain -containing protein [Rectinemataceae bacterium]